MGVVVLVAVALTFLGTAVCGFWQIKMEFAIETDKDGKRIAAVFTVLAILACLCLTLFWEPIPGTNIITKSVEEVLFAFAGGCFIGAYYGTAGATAWIVATMITLMVNDRRKNPDRPRGRGNYPQGADASAKAAFWIWIWFCSVQGFLTLLGVIRLP